MSLPLPPRILKKLPIRNLGITSRKVTDTVADVLFFELIREVLANTMYQFTCRTHRKLCFFNGFQIGETFWAYSWSFVAYS